MSVHTFRKLDVWQKGHFLTLEVYKATQNFPAEERFGLVSQIRRSSASICANIAEGYKKSNKEFVRFLDIAQGSLEETKYHLILANDLDYLENSCFKDLFELSNEVGRMMNGLIKRIKRDIK